MPFGPGKRSKDQTSFQRGVRSHLRFAHVSGSNGLSLGAHLCDFQFILRRFRTARIDGRFGFQPTWPSFRSRGCKRSPVSRSAKSIGDRCSRGVRNGLGTFWLFLWGLWPPPVLVDAGHCALSPPQPRHNARSLHTEHRAMRSTAKEHQHPTSDLSDGLGWIRGAHIATIETLNATQNSQYGTQVPNVHRLQHAFVSRFHQTFWPSGSNRKLLCNNLVLSPSLSSHL